MKKLILLSFIISLIACAPIPSTYEPVIDFGNNNIDYALYQKDLNECRRYAERVSPVNQAVGEALAGAAFGAAIGAIIGSGFNDVGNCAGVGAGSGGLSGAVHGGGSAIERQKRIIENCMRGRGYKVL